MVTIRRPQSGPAEAAGEPGAEAQEPTGSPGGLAGGKPKKGRGRPAFSPTKKQRRQVVIAAAGNMTHQAIATALGITRPTLEKHFAAELKEQATVCRLAILEEVHKAARRGNVAAARMFLPPSTFVQPPTKEERGVAAAAGAQKRLIQAEKKTPALGKKDQAKVDAQAAHVGTDWEDVLPNWPTQ